MTRSNGRPSTARRLAALALPLVLLGGLATASSTAAAAAEPVPGAQTSGDAMFPNVGNGGYDALDYDVAIAWTPGATLAASTIEATSTMTARAEGELSSFSLDFEGLVVDAVTVNGQPATWERIVDPASITFKLVITPAAPVSGTFTTTVAYHGVPSRHVDADGSFEGWNVTADGATMLGQPVGSMTGYPHNNTPADKATYTFTLDIPSTITNAAGTGAAAAVSNGELLSRTPSADGTRTTWVWEQREPMASELALVSIGKYDVIESNVTLTDGTVIPAWSFMDSALSETNKTTIRTRVALLETIIRNLETIYGPYPGNSTGVVVDTVPSGISYALETQDRSFFPSAGTVAGNTLIHELVHQWYGNHVSPTTWTDIWIAEGMATWGPQYYNSAEGFGAGNPSERTYFNSWNNLAASSTSWQIPPGAQTDSAELYGYQTYTRSAQFWAALRVAIRDEAYFALIEEWQTRYAGTSRTGADLLALAEELSGRDLGAFYQDWILDAGKPSWPDKVDVTLTAAAETEALQRGDVVTYTLSATNVGYGPLNASVVTVDVSSLLARATIDPATLPAGITLEGTTLTWAVPATPASATPPAAPVTATFDATIADDASGGTIEATAEVASLGGSCVDCATSLLVDDQPLDAATPVVSGTPQVGEELTAVTDGWTEGTTFAYQWLVDGEPVEGATDATFLVPASAVGLDVAVTVTGSAEGYVTEERTSEPVGAVVGAVLTAAAPVVTGTPRVGETLGAATDGWTEGTTFAYQWLVDGEPVDGATEATFVVPASAVGLDVAVTVTGSAEGYVTEERTSEPVGPVTAADVDPEPSAPAPSAPAPSAPAPSAPGAPAPSGAAGGLPVTGGTSAADALPWALALLLAGLGIVGVGAARRRAATTR
ncbi:M1 family aminopeptidase [Agrococcus sp. SGAir0287]|uniref:M1 family aminopeptidase n=1 Tax=Agrococcus sp. SGAir0287 TaxID=2070347 RepID=UPI0010CD477C|nr:M1 family aminopeptidase [Agrococcus sp. SGAir0287]QCR18356.1 hypothetical protein C1N71_01885 [Agrococcus sp. SGAir0287]